MAVTVNILLIPCGKCASPSLGKATAATRAAPPIPAMLPVCMQHFHGRAAMLGIFNVCDEVDKCTHAWGCKNTQRIWTKN